MLKFKINEHYLGYHYVWCSPVFEGQALGRGALGSDQPASSDPATIYRRLHKDVVDRDKHSGEIQRQRDSLKGIALLLSGTGSLTDVEAATIAEIVDSADIYDFRPVLYAIPYNPVEARIQLVQTGKRASVEPEYVIPDLKLGEFHMLEPFPCR